MSDSGDRVLTEVKVPPLGLPLFHCPSGSASTPPEPLWYPYEVLLLPSLITRSREWQAIYQEYLLYMLYLMSGGNTMKPLVIKLKIEEDFHWRYYTWYLCFVCSWRRCTSAAVRSSPCQSTFGGSESLRDSVGAWVQPGEKLNLWLLLAHHPLLHKMSVLYSIVWFQVGVQLPSLKEE